MSAPPIERVAVKPIRPGFAFVDVRLPGVSLSGIEARRDAAGRVTLTCPTRPDRNGKAWPIFALQPETMTEAVAAVAALWDQAGVGR